MPLASCPLPIDPRFDATVAASFADLYELTVAAVVCIVEREEANGRPAVEAAAQGAPFLRLFTATQVRAEHVRQLEAAKG